MVKRLTFQWPGAGGGRIDRGLCEESAKRAQFTYNLLCVMNFFQQRCAQEPPASERQLATLRDTATLKSTPAGGRLVHQGKEMPCAVVRRYDPSIQTSLSLEGLIRFTAYSIELSCNKPPRRAQRGNSVKARKPVSSETHAAPAHRHGASTPYLCWR